MIDRIEDPKRLIASSRTGFLTDPQMGLHVVPPGPEPQQIAVAKALIVAAGEIAKEQVRRTHREIGTRSRLAEIDKEHRRVMAGNGGKHMTARTVAFDIGPPDGE